MILAPFDWAPFRPTSGMGIHELRVYRLHPGKVGRLRRGDARGAADPGEALRAGRLLAGRDRAAQHRRAPLGVQGPRASGRGPEGRSRPTRPGRRRSAGSCRSSRPRSRRSWCRRATRPAADAGSEPAGDERARADRRRVRLRGQRAPRDEHGAPAPVRPRRLPDDPHARGGDDRRRRPGDRLPPPLPREARRDPHLRPVPVDRLEDGLRLGDDRRALLRAGGRAARPDRGAEARPVPPGAGGGAPAGRLPLPLARHLVHGHGRARSGAGRRCSSTASASAR